MDVAETTLKAAKANYNAAVQGIRSTKANVQNITDVTTNTVDVEEFELNKAFRSENRRIKRINDRQLAKVRDSFCYK